jgi:hypothetical protein
MRPMYLYAALRGLKGQVPPVKTTFYFYCSYVLLKYVELELDKYLQLHANLGLSSLG